MKLPLSVFLIHHNASAELRDAEGQILASNMRQDEADFLAQTVNISPLLTESLKQSNVAMLGSIDCIRKVRGELTSAQQAIEDAGKKAYSDAIRIEELTAVLRDVMDRVGDRVLDEGIAAAPFDIEVWPDCVKSFLAAREVLK